VRHESRLCSPLYHRDIYPIGLCHLLLFRRSTSGMKSSSSPCLGTPTGFALTTVVILLCRGELLVKAELCEAWWPVSLELALVVPREDAPRDTKRARTDGRHAQMIPT
jgi:hypothetical protein